MENKGPLSARRLAGYLRKRLNQTKKNFVAMSLEEAARVTRMSTRTMSRAFNFLRENSTEFKFRSGNSLGRRGRFLLVAFRSTRNEPFAALQGKDRGLRLSFSGVVSGEEKFVAFDGKFDRETERPTDNDRTTSLQRINRSERKVDFLWSGQTKKIHFRRGWAFARTWAASNSDFRRLPAGAKHPILAGMADLWAAGGWRGDVSHFGNQCVFVVNSAISDELPRSVSAYANGVVNKILVEQKVDHRRTVLKARLHRLRELKNLLNSGSGFDLGLSIQFRDFLRN